MIPTMTHKTGKVADEVQGMKFGKVAAIAVMTIAMVTLTNAAFAGGTVAAGAPTVNINESASLRLTDTAHIRSQVKAFGRLQLQFGQGSGPILRAAAQAESDGLTEGRLYDLWLITPEGKSVLVDTGRADQEFDEGDEGDSEIIVDLRGRLLPAPSDLTTREGVTVSIR